MSWLEHSYLSRKAVARGAAGKTHFLDKAVQGEYHYVYGPYAKPVMTIAPGDIVIAETEDAFGGALRGQLEVVAGSRRSLWPAPPRQHDA